MIYKTFKEDRDILNIKVIWFKHYPNRKADMGTALYDSLYHAKRDLYGNEKADYFKWEVIPC